MSIDYKNLNDRIVEQAYKGTTFVLDDKAKHQLIREKIERARIQQLQQEFFYKKNIAV